MFSQFQAYTDGMRVKAAEKLMGSPFVKTGPERAAIMPNAVFGTIQVIESLSVSNQRVWSACTIHRKACCLSR